MQARNEIKESPPPGQPSSAANYTDILLVAENKYGKDYIIGDVHGSLRYFQYALNLLKKNDRLFIVGDLTDRGPNSLDVIEKILAINKNRTEPQIYVTRGNHEEVFLDYYNTLKNFLQDPHNLAYVEKMNWAIQMCQALGQEWALEIADLSLLSKIANFFNSLPYVIKTPTFNMVHADTPFSQKRLAEKIHNNDLMLSAEEKSYCIWARDTGDEVRIHPHAAPEFNDVVTYCGHTICGGGRLYSFHINLDVGTFAFNAMLIVEHATGYVDLLIDDNSFIHKKSYTGKTVLETMLDIDNTLTFINSLKTSHAEHQKMQQLNMNLPLKFYIDEYEKFASLAETCELAVIKQLLKTDYDLTRKNAADKTPLEVAAENRNWEIAASLVIKFHHVFSATEQAVLKTHCKPIEAALCRHLNNKIKKMYEEKKSLELIPFFCALIEKILHSISTVETKRFSARQKIILELIRLTESEIDILQKLIYLKSYLIDTYCAIRASKSGSGSKLANALQEIIQFQYNMYLPKKIKQPVCTLSFQESNIDFKQTCINIEEELRSLYYDAELRILNAEIRATTNKELKSEAATCADPYQMRFRLLLNVAMDYWQRAKPKKSWPGLFRPVSQPVSSIHEEMLMELLKRYHVIIPEGSKEVQVKSIDALAKTAVARM